MALNVVPFTSKEAAPIADFFDSWKKLAEKDKRIRTVLVLACMSDEDQESVGLQIEQAGHPLTLIELLGLFELAKYDVTTSHDTE